MNRNPNRDLSAEQVLSVFQEALPHLLDGLGADREWLWWSGPKPSDADRKALLELGFSFSGRPHPLDDGRVAHWYHPCGGFVKRTGRKDGKPTRAERREARRAAREAAPSKSGTVRAGTRFNPLTAPTPAVDTSAELAALGELAESAA
jgi:hypothetical protein